MFEFLKGDQAKLSISVDRPNGPYYPGETVYATVALQGQKETTVQEVRAALVYSEQYEEREKEYDRNRKEWRTVRYTRTDSRDVDRQVLARDTVISGDTVNTWNLDWVIPPDAPPTYSGKIVQVKWSIKATLDRKLAMDINSEVELLVLSRPREHVIIANTLDQQRASSESQIDIGLPRYEWLEGETIQGRLVVTPKSDFDVTQVRAELIRVESVPAHEGNTETILVERVQIAGVYHFTSGTTVEFPLRLHIPAAHTPTLRTSHSDITWYVQGTLARSLRLDFEGQVEITVLSAISETQQATLT